jgi:RimJ/RimL family protein N-acetyltransferase
VPKVRRQKNGTGQIALPAGPDDPGLELFARHGRQFNEPVYFILRSDADKVLGGWAYTGYTGDTVQIHIAGDRGWMNRDILRRGFTYPFDVLGVKVIIAAIPGDNPRALKIGHGLGFVEFGAIEEIDLHLLKMSRAHCRWIHG